MVALCVKMGSLSGLFVVDDSLNDHLRDANKHKRTFRCLLALVASLLSPFGDSIISTSFSDGSVASSIDEERSLLRYLPRIADA